MEIVDTCNAIIQAKILNTYLKCDTETKRIIKKMLRIIETSEDEQEINMAAHTIEDALSLHG